MKLPEQFAPQRAAEQGREISGAVDISRFERLAHPYQRDGIVSVMVAFGLDEHSRIRLTGELHGSVAAVCQRCLAPMGQDFDAHFQLLLLNDIGQATALEEDAEYLVMESETLSLAELVEDELLLTLPMVPRHADGLCDMAVTSEESETHTNPFRILTTLKGRDGGFV